MTVFLGVDSGSRTLGFGVLSDTPDSPDIHYIDSFFVKIKGKDIFDRIEFARSQVEKICQKYNPDVVFIEDIIAYMPKKSQASTIVSLTTYNRHLCNVLHQHLKSKNGTKPILLNVNSIRHTIKKAGEKKAVEKFDVPDVLSFHLKVQVPVYLDKKGKIRVETYDAADGLACCYAGILKQRNPKASKPKRKKKKCISKKPAPSLE